MMVTMVTTITWISEVSPCKSEEFEFSLLLYFWIWSRKKILQIQQLKCVVFSLVSLELYELQSIFLWNRYSTSKHIADIFKSCRTSQVGRCENFKNLRAVIRWPNISQKRLIGLFMAKSRKNTFLVWHDR